MCLNKQTQHKVNQNQSQLFISTSLHFVGTEHDRNESFDNKPSCKTIMNCEQSSKHKQRNEWSKPKDTFRCTKQLCQSVLVYWQFVLLLSLLFSQPLSIVLSFVSFLLVFLFLWSFVRVVLICSVISTVWRDEGKATSSRRREDRWANHWFLHQWIMTGGHGECTSDTEEGKRTIRKWNGENCSWSVWLAVVWFRIPHDITMGEDERQSYQRA